jgi:hypothetical protein
MTSAGTGPPVAIFLIRHGEKPEGPQQPPFGVDVNGVEDHHSLFPLGWARAGALTVLFAPADEHLRRGLRVPTVLRSNWYGDKKTTAEHRSYETILPLSRRLGVKIKSTITAGDEKQLVKDILAEDAGVTLVCWEHSNIPKFASHIPTDPGTIIPSSWPDHRYDIIWCFNRRPGTDPPQYTFGQLPQRLLAGDEDNIISA